MYFALMLCTLFVACSFGAFAEVNYDVNDYKPAYKPAESWCAFATVPNTGGSKNYGCEMDQVSAFGVALTGYLADKNKNTCGTSSTCLSAVYFVDTKSPPSSATFKLTFTEKTNIKPDGSYTSHTQTVSGGYVNFSYQRFPGEYRCPPTDPAKSNQENEILAKYVIGPIKVGTETLCFRPKPNNCFSSPDFQLANQYHFDPTSAGKAQVCVKSDNNEDCPWKEVSTGSGVFQPDIDNKNACETDPPPPDSTPADKPQDPEKCKPGGNGMMVCKADPNEKCSVNSTGAMSCPDSCGYMNGEFMCFTEPDIPDDPNKPPKKPVPEPDDNITDPLKKMADMNKQDLKEIQRGVESRLEGFSASMENSMNELAAQGKNAEKAAGVGNKLLNSINQNTANTVAELKKIAGDESNPQPNYEETELGEKNDWKARNFGTVMKAAAESILEKPIFQAIDGYFDVSFGGSCPTWSVSVWVFEVEINQFCEQSFQSIFPLIRNVVILIFSILAFRVAFL